MGCRKAHGQEIADRDRGYEPATFHCITGPN